MRTRPGFREALLLLLTAALLAAMPSCGGGGKAAPPAISVSLAPAAQTTIDQGQTVNFTATVANDSSNKGVTWSVSGTACTGAACGTLTNTTATTAKYNAPASVSSNLTVSVKATSVADTTKSASSTVVVTPVPGITITSLSSGTANTAYSATLQASGGAGTLTWSVISGTLPPGLSLNSSTGVISGTPTSTGSWTFTVQVTDSGSPALSAQQQLTITVNPATLTITTTSLSSGTVGTAYNATVQSSGGTTPVTWSVTVGTLPAGLSLNSSTGAISGTPTTAATSDFTVTATDSATPTPQTASKPLSITVNPAPLAVTTTSLPDGTVSTAYNQTLTATGGTPPYTWSVTSGSLPASLTLSSSGSISGTPTAAATSNFTVTATDSATPTPQTASEQLSITISAPALSITTTSLSDGVLSTAYNTTLQASGGTPPITWSVTVGTLPAGLSLNSSTGLISGTPTTAATSDFTVTATDSATPTPQTATKQLSITIAASSTACGSGNESVLSGQYAFVLSGRGAGADIYNYLGYIGTVTFDGAGGITSGEFESGMTTGGGSSGNINPANSSYSVGSDNRGCAVLEANENLTIRFSLGAFQSGTATKGRIIEFEDPTSTAYIAAGQLLKQGTGWFSTPLSGNYVAAGSGWDTSAGRFGLAGAVSLSGGSSSDGELDWNDAGTLQHSTGLGGTVNDYGTGYIQAWMFGTDSIVSLRKVSQSQLLFKAFVWINYPALGAYAFGEMRKQTGPFDDSSLNAPAVFHMSALDTSGPEVSIGLFTGDGSGTASVAFYGSDAGTLYSDTPTCTYSVASNGRTPLSGSECSGAPVLYLTGANTAFMLGQDQVVEVGQAELQFGGPFNNASVSDDFFVGTDAVVSHSQETEVGVLNLDGAGNVTGTGDHTSTTGQNGNDPFTDTYSVNPDGTFTLGSSGTTIVGIVISGYRMVKIDHETSTEPSILVLEK